MSKLLKEPLVHFLAAAALLFAANALLSADSRETITVDTVTQDYLIKQEEDLRLRPLTEDEKKQVVEGFIEEEILVREARKKGLDNSSRIRQLLIQNMRFFVASDLPTPSEEDLEAWFHANKEKYQSPPAATYDHVVFTDPDEVPADTLEWLQAGGDHTKIGNTDLLNMRLPRMNQRMVALAFGPVAAPEILAIKDDRWHGPFETTKGAHFLRITERFPPALPEFEETVRWLRQDWDMSKQRELMDRELDSWRKNYRIEVLTVEAGA